MSGHYPWRAVKLARRYGLTIQQVAALPIEVYNLLLALPEPAPSPASRWRRLHAWFAKPSMSLADATIIAVLVYGVSTAEKATRWPWWVLGLAGLATICVIFYLEGFAKGLVKAAFLDRRRR